MKTVVGTLIVALVLIGAGGVSWKIGKSEGDVAALSTEVATLQFSAAADHSPAALVPGASAVPGVDNLVGDNSKDERATARYWLGQYDRISGQAQAGAAVSRDAHEQLLASNAAYRTTQAETVDRPTALKHLEDVAKSYAEILKANPDSVDAAYNYEFVVRARNTLARASATTATPLTPGVVGIAAATPGMHGRPGGPPKGVNLGVFRILVPKRSDERKESIEAGKGTTKQRKG